MAQAAPRCKNHIERTAVAKCKQCRQPICQRCVRKKPGGIYCSEECYEKMGSFQANVEQIDESRKPGFAIGKLVKWVVVLAVAGGVVYYIFVVEGVRSPADLVNKVKGLIP